MKKILLILFLGAITLGSFNSCCIFKCNSDCSYSGIQKELFCKGGKYQFKTPDGKVFRYYTITDLMVLDTKNNPKKLSIVQKKIIANHYNSFYNTESSFTEILTKERPPGPIEPCPRGPDTYWMPFATNIVMDLDDIFNIKEALIIDPKEKKYIGKVTSNMVTFDFLNRDIDKGIHHYKIKLSSKVNSFDDTEINIAFYLK